MNPSAYLRKAKKEYQCQALSSRTCDNAIRPSDHYLGLTIEIGEDRYQTRRICLQCADRIYPDLIADAMAKIKNTGNIKQAKRSVRDVGFLATKAKKFRRAPTKSEEIVWERLQNRALGVQFFRQQLLYGFIVDFWSPEKKLVIELDGKNHLHRKEKDQNRDSVLREQGILVLRFPAALVYNDIQFLLDRIRQELSRR